MQSTVATSDERYSIVAADGSSPGHGENAEGMRERGKQFMGRQVDNNSNNSVTTVASAESLSSQH